MLQIENQNPCESEYGPRVQTTCCYSDVENWVSQLSSDQLEFSEETKCELNEDSFLRCSIASLKQCDGYNNTQHKTESKPKMSLAEVYLLAQATRKTRERESKEENLVDSRAFMLRKAYATQKEFTASLQSEISINSAETKSSVDWLLSCRETDPEELLLSLGFGGPSQGIDRIPSRFLQSSKLNGVEVDKFLQQQQELADMFDTGSLGYRGLSGPSTRRPSMIVSRILEKMREQQKEELKRKFSAPPLSVPPTPAQIYPVIREQTEEIPDEVVEPCIIEPEHPRYSVNTQSTLSSRRSSLRRQDRVEEWEVDDEFMMSKDHIECSAQWSEKSDSSGFHESNALPEPVNHKSNKNSLTDPSNYYEDDLACSSDCTAASPLPAHSPRPDPILSILRLAVETYKSQLEVPISLPRRIDDPRDCNHNSIELRAVLYPEPADIVALREEINRELQRTESLLQKYQEQRVAETTLSDPTISSTLTEIADDLSVLLAKQQHLNGQLRDLWPVETYAADNSVSPSAPKCSSSSRKKTPRRKVSADPSNLLHKAWLQNLERRISSQIRYAVRRELRKALTIASSHPTSS